MAGAVKSNPKAHYNYDEYRSALRRTLGRVGNDWDIGSAGRQVKANCSPRLFQTAWKRDQVVQGLTLSHATIMV